MVTFIEGVVMLYFIIFVILITYLMKWLLDFDQLLPHDYQMEDM